MINYDKFKKSLKHLELQFYNYERAEDRTGLNDLDREALAESVIQRFETCYDTLWKHLKRYLNEELGLADIPSSPKPLFRLAAENNLLSSPVGQWHTYTDTRNETAHDYNVEKAAGCQELIPDFLDDAIGLYLL